MNVPWYVLVGVGIGGVFISWLYYILRKLSVLQTKEEVGKIHAESEEAIHNKSLTDLISDTNSRADDRRNSRR